MYVHDMVQNYKTGSISKGSGKPMDRFRAIVTKTVASLDDWVHTSSEFGIRSISHFFYW